MHYYITMIKEGRLQNVNPVLSRHI